MTNHLTRLRLLNHRANRFKRPERIREAIVKRTGLKIRVKSFNELRLAYGDICSNMTYFEHHLILIDNPEEGD